MSSAEIRPLVREDHEVWLTLWDGNNEGKRNQPVTDVTWERLLDPACPVFGICAAVDNNPVAILHYILHFTTGNIQPVAYIQDVYVDPGFRQLGIARALVKSIAAAGQENKWGRLYWLAEARNIAAQALYKNLGVRLDFTLHVWPLGKI
ncbi:MAG: GNAT family N-acetyltransferase [Alphaproteobacteria bacterium]